MVSNTALKQILQMHHFVLPPGIQHNHPDLAQNYDPFASTDINDSDQDPMPQVLTLQVEKIVNDTMHLRTTVTTSTGHVVPGRWQQLLTTESVGSGLPTMQA